MAARRSLFFSIPSPSASGLSPLAICILACLAFTDCIYPPFTLVWWNDLLHGVSAWRTLLDLASASKKIDDGIGSEDGLFHGQRPQCGWLTSSFLAACHEMAVALVSSTLIAAGLPPLFYGWMDQSIEYVARPSPFLFVYVFRISCVTISPAITSSMR